MKSYILLLILFLSLEIPAQKRVTLTQLSPSTLDSRIKKIKKESCEELTLSGLVCYEEFYVIAANFPNLKVLDAKQLRFAVCDTLYYRRKLFRNEFISIPSSAFLNHRNIEKVVLPDSTPRIHSSTFSGCTNLREVVFPPTVGVIDKEAFYGCINYKFALPEHIFVIDQGAFYGCIIPSEVKLPDSLIHYSFLGDRNIESYNLKKSNRKYRTIDGVLYSKDSTTIIAYPPQKKCFEIPSYVRKIGRESFQFSTMMEIVIPENIEQIEDKAFTNTMFQRIILPRNSEIRLGEYLFQALKELVCQSSIPYVINKKSLSTLFQDCQIIVPKGAKAAYEQAEEWRNFRIIEQEN